MRLVARVAPGAELLQRHHQLDRVEHPDHAGELRGRQAPREPHELGARDVDVDEHPRELLVGERHRLRGDVQVEAVGDEEAVDRRRTRRRRGRRAGRRRRPRRRAPARGRTGRPLATSPSSGYGATSISRRRSAPRARGEPPAPRRAQPSPSSPRAAVALGRLAHERRRCAAPPARRAARPTPRARRRTSGPGGAPCRSRGARRRGRASARPRARGRPRAGVAPPPARPRPGGRASRPSRGGRRRASVPSRAASSVTSSSGRPEGVADEIGSPRAERVVGAGSKPTLTR